MADASDQTIPEAPAGRLEELFSLHAHDMKRLAYLMTGDLLVAEDVVQEAFLRLAGRLGHFRDPSRFGAYLRKIVINLVRDHFRKKKGVSNEVVHSDRDLAGEHDVRAALACLPYRQRAALVLRYYLDLPDEETADLLQCRRSTVRSLVARGLESMKVEMEVKIDE